MHFEKLFSTRPAAGMGFLWMGHPHQLGSPRNAVSSASRVRGTARPPNHFLAFNRRQHDISWHFKSFWPRPNYQLVQSMYVTTLSSGDRLWLWLSVLHKKHTVGSVGSASVTLAWYCSPPICHKHRPIKFYGSFCVSVYPSNPVCLRACKRSLEFTA